MSINKTLAFISDKLSRRIRSWDALALGLLIAWTLVYYFPVTLGQQVFSAGDINWLFLPIRTELARALTEGRLPLWTPALQAGYPLFAEGEIAALYPLNLLLGWLMPAASAISYTILFNLIFASCGMYLLARAKGFRISSAWLAGFIFGFNGFMIAHLSHVPHLTVAAWLPWLVFFQHRYWQARRANHKSLGWFLVISGAIALQLLGGFPQFVVFNLEIYFLFGILAPFIWLDPTQNKKRGWQPRVRAIFNSVLVTLAPVIVAAGLAMAQLVPTIELTGLSIRAQEMGEYFFTSYSLDPSALTQFVLPFANLGLPQAGNMEYWVFIGFLPSVLVLLAPGLRRDVMTKLIALIAIVALVLALGKFTPIYDWLYYVPIFNRFRVPARFLFIFIFAAAYLAATGFDELQNRFDTQRQNFSLALGLGISAIVTIGIILFLVFVQPLDFWLAVWQWLPLLSIPLTLVIVWIGITRRVPRSAWITLVATWTMIDLAMFGAPFFARLDSMGLASDLTQSSRTLQAMDSTQTLYRVIVDKVPITPAAIRGTLYTNLPLLYQKQGVRAYLPSLGLKRNEDYIDQMNFKMRDLMNIRYYLLPLEIPAYEYNATNPLDETEPFGGLTLELLDTQPTIPPTQVSQIELVSYTDQTTNLPNGFEAGEITLGLDSGQTITLPIRLGIETADWAYNASDQNKHDQPKNAITYPAYLKSIGRGFDGLEYQTRYDVTQNRLPIRITSIGVHSNLPGAGLAIDRIALIDATGHATDLITLLNRMNLTVKFRSHAAMMWENNNVMPRAFVVHSAEITDDSMTLQRLGAADFDPARQVLLSDIQSYDLLSIPSNSLPRDQVSITQYQAMRVSISVQNSDAGYLVVTDSWYPGWIATVDNNPAPIYRADYIFRAVPLAAGSHTVTFEYRPLSFTLGTSISVVTLILVGFFGWVSFKKNR